MSDIIRESKSEHFSGISQIKKSADIYINIYILLLLNRSKIWQIQTTIQHFVSPAYFQPFFHNVQLLLEQYVIIGGVLSEERSLVPLLYSPLCEGAGRSVRMHVLW